MIPAVFVLMLQATPAPAACTTIAAPSAGLEAWRAAPSTGNAIIAIGTASTLALQPIGKVAFAPAPSRAPRPDSFGGAYRFSIATAGTYRIALGAGAWIDVIRDGKAINSVAHAEGPPCSGIRKIVDFALAPGSYTVQLSGARDASLRILIAKK